MYSYTEPITADLYVFDSKKDGERKDDGSAILYDIIKIKSIKIADASSVGEGNSLSGTNASANDNVSQNAADVNMKSVGEVHQKEIDAQKNTAQSGVRYDIKRTKTMSWNNQIAGYYGEKNY